MGLRVLLVDDEQDFVILLSQRLESRGFEPLAVFDGEEALKTFEHQEFDAVVLDLNLPGRSGLDILNELKSLRPSLPVIMLTGESGLRTAVEGMKRGAFDYLVKPVDIDTLAEALRQSHAHKIKQDESLRMLETGKLAALGVLAQGVAHEINNPLSTILHEAGWIEDLLSEPELKSSPQQEELRRAVTKIEATATRCKDITVKLLKLSNEADRRPKSLNVNAVVHVVLKEKEDRALSLGITIERNHAQDPLFVFGSAVNLGEAFGHIVDNALDAMGKSGGVLTIGTMAHDTSVDIVFTDSGPGIAPELLPRIFEPFFSTKAVGQGTGLGLSIAHAIIRQLGGEILVASTPGQGATFTVRLPAHHEQAGN